VDSAALFGLLGAVVGGGFTMLGTLLSGRQQDRVQRNQAARQRREQAYSNAIRHLLRATNRRSELRIESGRLLPMLSKADIAALFDDLVEAQYWVAVVTTVCSASQRERLEEARREMDTFVTRFANGDLPTRPDKRSLSPFGAVEGIYETVLSSARADLRPAEIETPRGTDLPKQAG
jgi:hypothetical protein